VTWAEFASEWPGLSWAFAFLSVGFLWYAVGTIRHSILARYNLEMAAQRTTQEAYLADLVAPILKEAGALDLGDPVHRKALARDLAARIVAGDDGGTHA